MAAASLTLMIFLTCSGGISSFCASTNPNFRFSPYLLELSCCHFLAWTHMFAKLQLITYN